LLSFENSTAALILVKRTSDETLLLRIAAVVLLGGLARISPQDEANKTGSGKRKTQFGD
jgi:hypothetical protein